MPASHVDKYVTALIENLLKTLAVALFILSYAFYIVFVKSNKMSIVLRIIVLMGLPVDGEYSLPQNKTRLRDWLRNTNGVQLKPTYHSKLCGRHFEERMLVISPSMARSVGDDRNSLRRARRRCHSNRIQQTG